MASNDVPEYLNELIPYRCPKCGHLRRFATLRELRQHLQSEHSFQMGFIKPHTRAHVFKGSPGGSNSSSFSRSISSEDIFNGKMGSKYARDTINELHRKNNEYHGNKKFRETSPLLKSFKEETELLEKELQQARQTEMKHKTLSMHNLSDSSVNTDFKKSLEAIQRPTDPKPKPENMMPEYTNTYPSHYHTNFVEKTKSYMHSPRGNDGTNYDFKRTLDTLNSEVMKSRMNQWVTTDALYRSQDLLKEMEAAAEQKCREQKGIIEQLILDMKTKDAMLESHTKQQAELSTERQRLLNETESIVKQTDDYNTRLRKELDGRGKVLEGLNRELEKLKTQSEQEIKTKDHDLQNATQKISKLEWERERLIQETDSILKRADQDTGKLKRTLKVKEEELKNVNKVLNQLRQQQQTMLERTMTVYRSSEEGREIMKTAIQTKDGQLQHAMKQIENMTSLHKRLLEQSQILTDQADDNTSSMKRLLQAKGEQIQDLVQQLDMLKREKRHLEENTQSLAEQAESSVSVVEKLRHMVKQKENDLRTTQSELQNLKSFLQSTADKERVARQKLEVFIEELIKRAEQAESELHVLKSQSTHSASTLQDVKMESFSEVPNSESTLRKSLPPKLHTTTSNYPTANTFKTHPSQYHQTDALCESYNPMTRTGVPLQNIVLTTADVHQTYPFEVIDDKILKVNEEENFSVGNDVTNMLNIKDNKLEESGGFVVQEEIYHSADSSYLRGQKHSIERNKSKSNPESFLSKPNQRKKSKESRKRYERSYESSSNETIDRRREYQRRTKKSSRGTRAHAGEKLGYSTDETHSDIHSNTEYYQIHDSAGLIRPEKNGKVNKGLQVGTFLSNQDLNNDYENESVYSDSVSDEDVSYSDVEYRDISRSNKPVDEQQKNITRDTERPVTMGKSPKFKSKDKKHHHIRSREKTRRYLNDNFDTTLPKSHRSMVNITSEGIDLSEGEVLLRNEERNRRSRSLSPRIIKAKAMCHIGDIEQFPGTSEYDGATDDDYDISMYENDIVEKTDGVFRNIMDDNGILWEDENATLPDVSDSEFDRESPSGSEALATKNTLNTTTSVFSKIKKSPKTSSKYENSDKLHTRYSQNNSVEISVSKDAHLRNRSSKVGALPKNPRNAIKSTKVIGTSTHRDLSRVGDNFIDTECSGENGGDHSKTTKVNFRPIKSPLYSKSSTSERDLTSGGKEVKTIMKHSPKVSLNGTLGTSSLERLTTSSRTNNRLSRDLRSKTNDTSKYTDLRNSKINRPFTDVNNDQYDTGAAKVQSHVESFDTNTFSTKLNAEIPKESIDERIERISSKYSPNRSNKLIKPDVNTPFNIDEKIQSINSKYKIRRNEILKGKGVRPSHTYPTIDSRTYISRSPATFSPSLGNNTSIQNKGPLSTATGFVLNKDDSMINQGIHVRPFQSPAFPSENNMPNAGYMNYAHPPWTSFTDNNSHQHMQYPYPFPPNWNQFPYFPLFLGNEENVLKQQQQQQQQLQQHHQLKNEERTIQDKETNEQNKDQQIREEQHEQRLHQDGQQIQNQQNIQYNKQQDNVTNTIDTTACNEKEIKQSVASPYDEQITEPNEMVTKRKGREKTNEMKECERGHSSKVASSPNLCFSEKPKIFNPDEINIKTFPESVSILNDEHDRAVDKRLSVDSPANVSTDEIEQLSAQVMSEGLSSLGDIKLSRLRSTDPVALSRKNSNKGASNYNEEIEGKVATNSGDFLIDTQSGIGEKSNIELNSEVNHQNLGNKMNSDSKSRLSLFEDTLNDDSSLAIVNKSSMFAEEIGEESSAEYDSNTQSYLDLPDGITDTDFEGDTDTESVRRDFYENTNRIKELLNGPQNDFSDVYRHKFSRNTTSSASSQASLEILDRIPTAKREQVKQRRAALVCIFSFLDTRTLSRVARVCREWRIVSRSPKLWRRVEIRGEKISPQFLRKISRRCTQLRVLILEDLHPRNRYHDETVEDYQKNIRCSLEPGYEQILKKAEGTLHTIVIVNCGTLFSAKCLWIASCCCRMLNHVTYSSDFDPINAEVMWALGSGCRELKTLKCQPIFPCMHADNFTTKCAQLIGKCFRDLEIVSVGGMIVDVNALIFIAKQCQKLKEVEVHHMKYISCDAIDEMCQNGLLSLRIIRFHATPVAPGALAVLQGNCKHLDSIYIQLTETDFEASVTNQSSASQLPDYHEIIDGYEALKKQQSLYNILTLKVERPKTPQPIKEPVQERSFFDRLFGKND